MCLAPAMFYVWYWGYRDYIIILHKQDDTFAVERIMPGHGGHVYRRSTEECRQGVGTFVSELEVK